MKNIKSLIRTAGLLGVCVALFGTSSSYAVSGSWNVDAAGNWSDPANWTSNPTVPGGVGDTINLTYDITANRTVTIDTTPRTAGILNIGDASHLFTLSGTGGGYLVMDNNGNQAEINIMNGTNSASSLISAPLRLTTGGLLVDKELAAGTAIISSAITTVTPGTKTITMNSAGGSLYLSGVISGDIGIDWNITGVGFLTQNNTFTGGVRVLSGEVRASTGSYGTGSITLGGVGAGNATLSGNGTRNFGNNIIVSSGNLANTLRLTTSQGNSSHTYSGNIDLQRELELRGVPTSMISLTGTISGAGSLKIAHGSTGGAVTLAGNGSYTGGVSVDSNNMSLHLGHAAALGTGTFTISSAASGFALDSTVANLALSTNNAQQWQSNFTFVGTNDLDMGTGAVTINSNRTVTVTAGTLVIGGAIDDGPSNYGLIKNGGGTLALNGNSTYGGDTEVSGGTLRGNGSVAGDLFLYSGATLEAGNSIGTFTTAGEAWFDTGSTYKFELNSTNGTYDQLVASSLSLESNVTFSVDDLGTGVWTGPASFVIVENTSGTAVDGIFDGYAEGSSVNIGDNVFTISYVGGTGNDVTLTYNVIPEPGAWMLVTLGLGLTLLRRRRA